MKEIFTAKGERILVDDEDYAAVSHMTWGINNRGYVRYQKKTNRVTKSVSMHRFLLGLAADDPRIVDHANGIKTDNRRCNLRICSKNQNGYNQGPQRNNTTGFKGVTRIKTNGRFVAVITSAKRKIHLGSFKTAHEAHQAYCKAARELHGEFANLGLAASEPKKD